MSFLRDLIRRLLGISEVADQHPPPTHADLAREYSEKYEQDERSEH